MLSLEQAYLKDYKRKSLLYTLESLLLGTVGPRMMNSKGPLSSKTPRRDPWQHKWLSKNVF